MTDAISVIGPGWRATDTSGNLITDGILAFFDAGTSNERTVYSDSSLSTSLGTTVDCNSAGYPVTSGNARTLIYTGSTAYKVRLTSVLAGGTVWEHDNVLGALDTTNFLTEAAVADQSVVNVSVSRSITSADKGKLINMNCSGGVLTATMADAATLGDGFFVGIRHSGTANQVKITGDGTDTFAISGATPTGFALTGLGHSVWIVCDGANFKVHSECPPLIGGTVGVIAIADRLSTPPGSPTPGARYLVGSSPTGNWSTFSQHDIAESDGFSGWFKYTPAADCGWIAYVQDEDLSYQFIGSTWRPMVASVGCANALVITNNSTVPTTSMDIDADEAILIDSEGIGLRVSSVDLTIDCTTTGENGLDTGSLANSTWYYLYIISDTTTTAGLMSTSATSPTMPSGYSFKYRVGAVMTNGSALFMRIKQVGNVAEYEVVDSSTTTDTPAIGTDAEGSTTTPTWVEKSLASFVPPTATIINLIDRGSGSTTMLAPSDEYGPRGGPNRPPYVFSSAGASYSNSVSLVLLEYSIYRTATASWETVCQGWVDAVNAN